MNNQNSNLINLQEKETNINNVNINKININNLDKMDNTKKI